MQELVEVPGNDYLLMSHCSVNCCDPISVVASMRRRVHVSRVAVQEVVTVKVVGVAVLLNKAPQYACSGDGKSARGSMACIQLARKRLQ